MKRSRYIGMMLLILVSLVSCDSFLDIKPKGQLIQDEQFKDVQGCRDAMYGVYASMALEDLYGMKMSWGLVDVLGQMFGDQYWQFADGDDASSGAKFAYIKYASAYKYDDQRMEKQIETIWTKMYECISYVNNVINNVDKKDVDGEPVLRLIKGEAHAVRAFLHFEIMRLFCDNYRDNPNAGGIPYAYNFDLNNKKVFTLAQCYDNVLSDLQQATRDLAADKDIYNDLAAEAYHKNRYSHCNLYAVWALKARVFYTKGDLDSAAYYAEKVVTSSESALVEQKDFSRVKRYGGHRELIWGLFNTKMYSTYKDLFLRDAVALNASLREDIEALYGVASFTADSKDLRYTNFFQEKGFEGFLFTRLLTPTEAKDNHPTIYYRGSCLIRLPEMYYILAELEYAKDKSKAISYLNAVRYSRGLTDIAETSVNTPEKFFKEITRERMREFYGEGQMFAFYKCHNIAFRDFLDTRDIEPSRDIFVLPWPKSEREFGVTNE